MSYDSLAAYYDALVKDEEATAAWLDYTRRYLEPCSLLELACGSGEISIALAEAGYTSMDRLIPSHDSGGSGETSSRRGNFSRYGYAGYADSAVSGRHCVLLRQLKLSDVAGSGGTVY
ncbi:MAG: hypothetical protein ACLSA6_16285 [Holdemania massiliensis]